MEVVQILDIFFESSTCKVQGYYSVTTLSIDELRTIDSPIKETAEKIFHKLELFDSFLTADIRRKNIGLLQDMIDTEHYENQLPQRNEMIKQLDEHMKDILQTFNSLFETDHIKKEDEYVYTFRNTNTNQAFHLRMITGREGAKPVIKIQQKEEQHTDYSYTGHLKLNDLEANKAKIQEYITKIFNSLYTTEYVEA